MDGRIGETINSLVLDSEVPANKARLEPPSNRVGICPDVTPRLDRSSPPVEPSDRARTVSLTDASLHDYNYRWAPLPQEVLNRIASYLSINDINHFGLTSSMMDHRLRPCGLGEVHHYLSLTRPRQSSCRAIIQSSHLLLEYLRTLSIFSVRRFPVQLSPAFYSYYASHSRQQILDGATLTLVPNGSINVKHFDHHLRDHIPIIIERKAKNYSDILAPDRDGHWVSKAEIKHSKSVSYGHQYADHILFVPQSVRKSLMPVGRFHYEYSGKEHLLSVYECKNDSWVEQKLTTDDVFPQCEDKYMDEMHLSPDARSLACIHKGRTGAILGQGADGQWLNRGNINTGQNHTSQFSADSKHLALYDGSFITLMSKADDGSWSQTGDIVVKDPDDDFKYTSSGEKVSDIDFDLKVLFSPDNRHFVTWFEDAGEDSDEGAIERDYFFVVIFAYSPEGQWHEKKRIIKTCDEPSQYFYLKPRFSPNGQLLTITTKESFDIWELDSDDQWLPSAREQDHCGAVKTHFSLDPCEFIRSGRQNVTIWRKATSGTWGQTQTFPAKSLVITSPSGETIVCNNPVGHTDIYQRKPFAEPFGQPFAEPAAEWVNQRIEFSIIKAHFNQEGCLLAVIPEKDTHSLVLLGLTTEGRWLERNHLQTEGEIKKFCISPCSRTLQVTSVRPAGSDGKKQEVFSHWQTMPDTASAEPDRE